MDYVSCVTTFKVLLRAISVCTASGQTLISRRVIWDTMLREGLLGAQRCQWNHVEGGGAERERDYSSAFWSWVDKSCKDLNN